MSFYMFYDSSFKKNEILNKNKYKIIYEDVKNNKYLIESSIRFNNIEEVYNLDSLDLVSTYLGDSIEDVFLHYPQLDSYTIDSDGNYKHIIEGFGNEKRISA